MNTTRTAFLIFLFPAFLAFGQSHTGWSDYGGGADSAQYSALKQINRSNVSKLEVAWTYPTGDNHKYFFNPLVVDNVIYVLAKNNSIVALDAATGKEIWAHPADPGTTIITNRGINYWESKDRTDRPPAVLRAITRCRRSMRAPGSSIRIVRQRTAAWISKKAWAATRSRSRWCNPPRPAASSRTC